MILDYVTVPWKRPYFKLELKRGMNMLELFIYVISDKCNALT